MMKDSEIQEKIKEYERFVEEKLKIDLKDIETLLADRAAKYKEWKEVQDVSKTVKEFKEKDRDMKVMFDIGNNVLCTGEVTNYSQIYVNVGLGCLLEMDPEEIDKYSDIRLRLISKEIDQLRKLAVNVKVHIKMVLLAINELQSTLLDNLSHGQRSNNR